MADEPGDPLQPIRAKYQRAEDLAAVLERRLESMAPEPATGFARNVRRLCAQQMAHAMAGPTHEELASAIDRWLRHVTGLPAI